ncbi:MAG: ATP-dependent zinc protease family protein [Alcanivorax sp.]|uniref:ATP-dependent zinc protease family protein n=1 Tax=Alcanivorax sp. TaxID=1872427 RepID=UPI003DA76297
MMRLPLVLIGALVPAAALSEVPVNKRIYGLHESVHIGELGITVPAKLDTGADSASLSARYIKTFERDGVKMVEFDIAIDRDDREEWGIQQREWDDVELPLTGHVRIKRRAESVQDGERDFSRRPMVTLTICMGGRQQKIDVNLTDRSEFRYPLLIGADALMSLGALVDPSLSMSVGTPRCREDQEDELMMEAAGAH